MKKIYLSPGAVPLPRPLLRLSHLFEHDVTTSIAQKTAAALTRCGFSVKWPRPRPPCVSVWRKPFPGRLITTSPSTPMPARHPQGGPARGPEVLAYGQPGGISWRACQMTYEELMAIYPAATTRGVRQNTTFYEINSTPHAFGLSGACLPR